METAELLGRDHEQAVLRRVLERAENSPAGLLLEGEAGIDKTTVWREGIAQARERGFRILACEAALTETPLSFAALGDLLDEVPLSSHKRLPPPQRKALETSLLLIEPGDGKADQRAVSVAVLTLVRSLAAKKPILIAIDDVQWLDASSARVLAFVLRRLREGPIGLLMTRRSDEGAGGKPPLDLDTSDGLGGATESLTIGPLSLGAIRRLLTERTGHRVPRAVLNQLYRAAGGNGAWMVNNNYDKALAEKALTHGADLIAFGKLYLANPDLVERLRDNAPLNTPDTATFYGGGAKGYTDYPMRT